jgi:hypothetical protein
VSPAAGDRVTAGFSINVVRSGQLQTSGVQDAVTAIWEAFSNQLGEFGVNPLALSRVPVLSGLHWHQIRQPFL